MEEPDKRQEKVSNDDRRWKKLSNSTDTRDVLGARKKHTDMPNQIGHLSHPLLERPLFLSDHFPGGNKIGHLGDQQKAAAAAVPESTAPTSWEQK